MKILLVEDDSEDAEFLRLSLAQHNHSVSLKRASLVGDAVAALENDRFDVVLLDLNLPDARGAECVERIRKADDLMPIVVLSGVGDEDFAVEILNRGVQDYLVKWEGDGRIILRAIRYAIERKRAEVKLTYLARFDWLTTLPNPHYLRDAVAHATKRALRSRTSMALVLLDLDGFKAVNETHGHAGGDALLRAAAQRLKAATREGDLVARFGGDEFAFVLEGVEGAGEIEALARTIAATFREPFPVAGQPLAITASLGLAVFPADGADAAALLNNAETALAQARQQGPSASVLFASLRANDETLSSRALEASLAGSVDGQPLELEYQPQLRLADHRIEAVEALVAESESTSLAPWVLEEICGQLARWESAGVPVPRVAIKLPAAQFRQAGFHDALRGVLEAHSIDPALIELELAERSLMDDAATTRERLHALHELGVRLAIDDFAGRLPLGELKQLPLDVLKLEPALVADLDASKDAQAVCAAILAIAHGFALDAVASGVRSEQQEAFLSKHNCLYGQGPYYAAPLEADGIAALLAESGGQATRRRRAPRKRAAKAG